MVARDAGRFGGLGARGLEWEAAIVGLVAALWRFRLEIVLLVLMVGGQRLLVARLGEWLAGLLVLVLVCMGVAVGPSRRLLVRRLRLARLRRAWERAAGDVGLAAGPLLVPRVLHAARFAAGDELRVRVRRGQSIADLDARRSALAACLRVREVRVEPEPADAAEARVMLVRRDPFEQAGVLRWRLADADEVSVWDPVPVGVDERGEDRCIGLVERNVLVGGEPGAGKSVVLSTLVAAGVLDPATRVWLLDGKLVELAVWAPVAERLVGPDGEEAIAVLRELQAVMDERYRELRARASQGSLRGRPAAAPGGL